MTASRIRRVTGLVLVTACAMTGPAAAACSSCCPSEPERELAFGPMDCCGDQCAPTLERVPADSVPAGNCRGFAPPSAVAAAVSAIPVAELIAAAPPAASFDLPPPLLPAFSPLRL